MAHLEAMKKVIKEQNPELNVSDQELTQMACQAIAKSYCEKASLAADRVGKLEEVMKKYEDYKSGKITLSETDAKILEGQKALISPSQYKAALVEQQVFQMKANNVRWSEVNARMPQILAAAERKMVERYGGNWGNVIVAEIYANGLAQYKYNPDGTVNVAGELKKLTSNIPRLIQTGVVDDFRTRVDKAIVGSLIPPNSAQQNEFEKFMQAFGKTAISQGSGSALDSILNSSKERIFSGFSR